MNKRSTLLIFLLLNFSSAYSQSTNDQTAGVQMLIPNSPFSSSTDFNSIQSNCVDEKLTGQCIQYHNDQWFSYVPESNAPVFINVYGQSCKNDKGVQLVVFTGELCDTTSYQILQCISTATPADYYYKVEHPGAGEVHYMIIDGYLADFCDFAIEVSSQPRGLPALRGIPAGEGKIEHMQNIVELKWRYNPVAEEQWNRFKVVRSGTDAKIWLMPLAYNAGGRLITDHQLLDTLTKSGSYTYDVYLVNENDEHRIHPTQKVVWDLQKDPVQTVVYFPFAVARKTDLQVSIRDPLTGRVLLNKYLSNYSLPGFEYDFAELIKSGKLYFEVQVQDLKTKRKEVFEQFF